MNVPILLLESDARRECWMAKICTEAAFKNLIGKYPYLCSKGLMTPEYSRAYDLYFRASRDALAKEYRSFTLSCEWLSKCRFLNGGFL